MGGDLKMKKNTIIYGRKNAVVLISAVIVLASFGVALATNNKVPQNINPSFAIEWDVQVNFNEPGGANDYVVFGEAPDANDGPPNDAYDAQKPPAPFPPYIYAWLDDGLAAPFNLLFKDYRKYPDTTKQWNLTVLWYPSGSPSSTTVTISWNPNDVDDSEYDVVELQDSGGGELKDMLTDSSYSYTAPAYTPQYFYIYCWANTAPNAPSNPDPADGETDVDLDADLSWDCTDPDPGQTLTYDVYFGDSSPPPLVSSGQSASSYDPGTMDFDTTYYWQIVAEDNYGASTTGPEWDFTTVANSPPNAPSNPDPEDGETGVSINADLSWDCTDPDPGQTLTYDVYFGDSSPPPLVSSGQSASSYDPGTMDFDTTYYWQIVAEDNYGASTTGPEWDFTTEVFNTPPNTPDVPEGPSTLPVGEYGEFCTSGTDPDGDQVQYRFDWDDGTYSQWTNLVPSGTTACKDGAWGLAGTYEVRAQSRDEHFAMSDWSEPFIVTVTGENTAPNKPTTPTGETTLLVGEVGEYCTSATDPDEHQVQYQFDWGDGTQSEWTDFVPSGTTDCLSNSWDSPGTYKVKSRARDELNAYSAWSDELTVIVQSPEEEDLNCEGELKWSGVVPGNTVTGIFKVKNDGGSGSELDWEITEWPDWGSFSFSPDSGEDLTPEDGDVTIEVSVVAPESISPNSKSVGLLEKKDQDYEGEVKIVNKNNANDYCTIDVLLTIPRTRESYNPVFLELLKRLVDIFPMLERLFNIFPLFNFLL
jgi:hypothetical protein